MNETRYARLYIWVDPSDCEAPHSLDLKPGSRDSLKVEKLQQAFEQDGFDLNEPALVAYPYEGRIQLLSGTHRHEAAKRAGIKLPVHFIMRSLVEAKWGTAEWNSIIQDIPVRDLECVEVPEHSEPIGIGERIDLARDYE